MKIVISAPEVSSDLLASRLIPILKERYPDSDIVGLIGEHSINVGVTQLWDTQSINVMGFVEVLKKLIPILRIRRKIISYCLNESVDMFIGVDGPDFNFAIERQLKAKGIATVHFVSPSIWAWRKERMHVIKKAVDSMLCVFPFEPALYHKEGISAHFVGHPLATLAWRKQYQISKKILLMPGSRKSEIHAILPTLVRTVNNITSIDNEYSFHIPIAHESMLSFVESWVAGTDITYSVGDAHEHIANSDLVVVASGTAALEVALIGTPMVVVYKMHPLTYRYAKRKLTSKYVSLPNIILQKQVVLELIQDECTQVTLVSAMFQTLGHIDAIRERFSEMRTLLEADFSTQVHTALAELEETRI